MAQEVLVKLLPRPSSARWPGIDIHAACWCAPPEQGFSSKLLKLTQITSDLPPFQSSTACLGTNCLDKLHLNENFNICFFVKILRNVSDNKSCCVNTEHYLADQEL